MEKASHNRGRWTMIKRGGAETAREKIIRASKALSFLRAQIMRRIYATLIGRQTKCRKRQFGK